MARVRFDGLCTRQGDFSLGPLMADVPAGLVGLVGRNGTGKSTLLKAMAGILPAHGGMDVEGEVWLALPPQLRAQRMGYLPQQPQLAWDMKVEEVVALGLTPWPNMPGAVRQRQVQAALERCDAAGFAGRRYQALSGGQRQRVMLARAMAGKPGLLLLDEPCANLDPEQQLRLMALFLRLVKEGLTLWMVCHDVALASRFCHHILLFDGKGLAAQGTVKQVFDAENLRHCFGIEAKTVGNTKETCILPWRPAG